MTNVISLEFPKCCECGARAIKHVDLVDESGAEAGQKHFCADHGNVLTMDDLCLLVDKRDGEIAGLRKEIADLKSASGQTDEEVAEMIARFRTPPGFNWEGLRDDIITLLASRRAAWEAAQ